MPVQNDPHLPGILDTFFSTTSERIGAAISVGMISSPLWVERLKPISDAAAVLAPILGCTYLSMQISFKVFDRMFGGRK